MIIEKSIVEQRIISVQNGNMEDFDLLYRYTREFLYMYALSVVKDYYMADDAVQEAFISLQVHTQIQARYKPLHGLSR